MELKPGDLVTVDDGLELVEGTVTRLEPDCVWVRVERSGIEVPVIHGDRDQLGYPISKSRARAREKVR